MLWNSERQDTVFIGRNGSSFMYGKSSNLYVAWALLIWMDTRW